jgi:hypothetical protein
MARKHQLRRLSFDTHLPLTRLFDRSTIVPTFRTIALREGASEHGTAAPGRLP